MQENKHGFTLTEVLLSMVIIGVIMGIGIQSVKTVKSSYSVLSYYVFQNLNTAVGEIMAGATPYTSENIQSATVKCKNSDGVITSLIKGKILANEALFSLAPCSQIYKSGEGSGQSSVFCENIAAMSNTSGAVNCSKLYPVESEDGEPSINADFAADTPNMIMTNGHRYFFSQWRKDDEISKDYGYRLIAVDVNATRRPNTSIPSGALIPDVVQFLIFDNGEIFPVGVAADNVVTEKKTAHYLSARAKGYYFSNAEPDNGSSGESGSTGRDRDLIPSECLRTGTCNFAVVPLAGKSNHAMSYREAYCTSIGLDREPTYKGYCDDANIDSSQAGLCPPSSAPQRFDYCTTDLIKPAFRYNIR